MISLLDHIEYLTIEHDCVIVPGLGAFVSQYAFNKNHDGVIESINRNISFNPSIDHNDGLLANSIVRKESISYEAANIVINNYVCSLMNQLKYDGEVPVGRLGFFCFESNKPVFYPFPSKMVKNNYYGLSQIKLRPISVETKEKEEAATISKNKINKNLFTHRYIQIAASILLLLGLTFVLSTPVFEHDSVNYANLNIFTIKQSEFNNNGEILIAIPKATDDIQITEEEILVEETTEVESETQELESISKTGNYCIVVASLATMQQAKKYVKETGLTNYEIFKSTQKYRVYIARGTFDDMITLKESNYANSDAWVCRMK